jgi:glycosyltransferase involved in cell wall biosynthesis
VSVLIPTKNRPKDVLTCVGSVNNQSVKPGEIIIVDASDEDGLDALIRSDSGGETKIVYVRTEAGLTHQKNIGVQKSSGDIVLILDDDIILDEDYIKEIVKVFNNPCFDAIGCVFGEHIWPNKDDKRDGATETLVCSIRRTLVVWIYSLVNSRLFLTLFFLQGTASKTGKFRLSGFQTYPSNPEASVYATEFAPGGFTAYYKKVLNEFKFDENLKGYAWGEDADFSYRISRKYKNICTTKAKVLHVSKTSKIANYAYSKMRIEHHHYLFKKNFPQALRNRFAFNMSVLGLFLRELVWAAMTHNSQGVKGFLDGLRAAHEKNSNKF